MGSRRLKTADELLATIHGITAECRWLELLSPCPSEPDRPDQLPDIIDETAQQVYDAGDHDGDHDDLRDLVRTAQRALVNMRARKSRETPNRRKDPGKQTGLPGARR